MEEEEEEEVDDDGELGSCGGIGRNCLVHGSIEALCLRMVMGWDGMGCVSFSGARRRWRWRWRKRI